jgi:hypothetical protein
MEEPFYSLKVSSSNYWAGRTGRDCPPPASLRTIDGKPILGRYLDPFGCEACMVWARQEYQKKLHRVLVVLAVLGVASLLDVVFLLIVVPLFVVTLWIVRGQFAKHFGIYHRVNEEIQRSGKPVWEPFDKVRLHYMRHNPNSVWP